FASSARAMPLVASAQFKVETVWQHGVINRVANPIPGLDAGWTKPTANGGTTADTRFATGKDGKILVNNHISNEIQSWDGKEFATVCKLPTVTSTVWNGTAISTDDAGNVILNFGFTDVNVSVCKWAVLTDGVLTEVTLSTPISELNLNGRLDIISHIVGDVTSEKGGIGYSTIKATDHLVMFHFKGDGTKVTSVTAKASAPVEGLAAVYGAGVQTETYQAAAKLLSIDEILSSTHPEDEFYLPVGKLGPSTETVYGFEAGVLANYDGTLGNRGFGAVATMLFNGKKYIIRNYVAESNPNIAILTNWRNVMQFGIFDEDGTCVATWEGSTFTNSYGSSTFAVEMVDETTANIYVYAATGNDDDNSGTKKGCYAAMVKVTLSDEEPFVPTFEGDGTEANPYKIATAEDLCNAYRVVNGLGCDVWFEQTADIDMTGVKEYHAIAGYDGNYAAVIHYDGKNHLISNFAPDGKPFSEVAETNFYYCTSVFGVASGEISNLGVINANCVTDHGAGILGAYAGHSNATPLILDNVFVTGTVVGTGGYTGGMFGTTGNIVTMTSCFANVNVKGEKFPAGLIGRASNDINLERVYTAGTVEGPDAYLVMGTNKAPEFNGWQVVAFNTGAEAAIAPAFEVLDAEFEVATDETKATLIDEVKNWKHYSKTSTIFGLPP
ncbi:MAG: hypothetical protein K2J10_09945, partial [Muribaculaceae bacterium]|nr:hypothetical protein [Muribaculaceae bacterium]